MSTNVLTCSSLSANLRKSANCLSSLKFGSRCDSKTSVLLATRLLITDGGSRSSVPSLETFCSTASCSSIGSTFRLRLPLPRRALITRFIFGFFFFFFLNRLETEKEGGKEREEEVEEEWRRGFFFFFLYWVTRLLKSRIKINFLSGFLKAG